MKLLAVRRGRPLLRDGATFAPYYLDEGAGPAEFARVPLDEPDAAELALLDVDADLTDDAALEALGVPNDSARFADVMMHLGRYATVEREIVLRAVALSQWSHEYRFCPVCSRPLTWDFGSRTKSCTNPGRPHRHFPRTDPATIMLVTAEGRALLGRQRSWPPGMYSTLAGFIEPGETAEAGVAREVFEETGVRVRDVCYFGSESWPFPRSLMLGYTARATTHDIAIGEEMDDVRWFTRDEVAKMQASVTERLPYFDTIARRLLAAWVAAET